MAAKPTPLEQAFAVIRRLEEQTARLSAPLAIVGLACRFPGAPDAAAFRALLWEGRDAIGDPPENRQDLLRTPPGAPVTTLRGGYLPAVDLFEPEFFGIAPREAAEMDPQQRLALEVSSEAIADAGIAASDLRNSRTGVFLGISQTDYGRHLLDRERAPEISAYAGTGGNPSAAAGRIAYWLGLRGPCLAVDTACSSSLTAIHLAAQSLRVGECDLALCGGVHLNLFPEVLVFLSRANALSPDGRSKAFDASADGYGRGEGCGMLALKRLDDATRDGDRIWAVIRGSAINHDGPSSGFTVPNGLAQRALIEAALRNAKLQPRDIQFVEAHGTGTLLGDPIEIEAAGAVYAAERPLYIGSVKANIGHLEAAAGVAGVIKAVLAVREGSIPAQPEFREPNPRIPWKQFHLRVAARTIAWPAVDSLRRAAVSAFGLSGSNAHLILEQAPEHTATHAPLPHRPFQRRRFWTRSAESLYDRIATSPLLEGALITSALEGERRLLLDEHRVDGHIVVPGAFHIAMTASAYRQWRGAPCTLHDIVFPQALRIDAEATLHLRFEGARFRIASDTGTIHAEGSVDASTSADSVNPATLLQRCPRPLALHDFDAQLAARRLGLGPRFRWFESIHLGDGEALARIRRPAQSAYDYPPGLIDACLQLISPLLDDAEAYVPWRIGECRFHDASLDRAAWLHATSTGAQLLDEEGRPLLTLSGIELRRWQANPSTRLAYRMQWDQIAVASTTEPATIFACQPVTTTQTLLALADLVRKGIPHRLIVATCSATDPNAGLVWGFARTLAMEHPQLHPILVDLESPADATQLPAIAATVPTTAWLRIRNGRIESARLSRMDLSGTGAFACQPATWLITGGLGSLGRQLAAALSAQGARRIVLGGRRPADLPALPGIEFSTCDVTDAAAVEALVSELAAADPPLRGIIHAAGIRRDQPALSLDAAAIDEVLAAKSRGAWNLHQATRNIPLDAFVLIASAAGALGSPGQAAYAAANAALDFLAHERRTLGLPAVSIDYGPWRDSAMLSGLTAAQQKSWRDRGITPLDPADALRDFFAILASGEPQVLYLDADWPRLAKLWGDAAPEFLPYPRPSGSQSAGSAKAPTLDWHALPFEEARARMHRLLRDEVAAVLALDQPFKSATPFFDLGMDSLTALELRNRLQTRFALTMPATLLFDCPSLDPLGAWMLEQLGVHDAGPTESELEQMLLAKIGSLEARGIR